MVIRESLRVEEPDFYQGQILQTHAKKKKCINVRGHYISANDTSVEQISYF
jgi:hypothetical protein